MNSTTVGQLRCEISIVIFTDSKQDEVNTGKLK